MILGVKGLIKKYFESLYEILDPPLVCGCLPCSQQQDSFFYVNIDQEIFYNVILIRLCAWHGLPQELHLNVSLTCICVGCCVNAVLVQLLVVRTSKSGHTI